MMSEPIQVFEHQHLKVGHLGFTQEMLNSLQRHYGTGGLPYYSLIHNGIKFNQFVGVIQVGKISIEVLPKVDRTSHLAKNDNNEKSYWQKRLIEMLLAVNIGESKITGTANLALKTNSILEAYFALFLDEAERLLHRGLIKQYHKQQGNLTALKGRLNFPEHIRRNCIHQERFFVEYTEYDANNLYNKILYKTLKLISQLNTNQYLSSRVNHLLLSFPEMGDIYVDDSTFEHLIFNRKNQHYKQVLAIAKLLLLNYHPDITGGRSSVLSLMFDMNRLWEQFVFVSLKRHNKNPDIQITAQLMKKFWTSELHKTTMRADIFIRHTQSGHAFVFDTKWKNLNQSQPSIDDLRQLYSYHHYYQAKKVALVYPSSQVQPSCNGQYVKTHDEDSIKTCGLVFLHLPNPTDSIHQWQKNIYQHIFDWIEEN